MQARISRLLLLAGTVLAASTSIAMAGPDYQLVTTIALPVTGQNNQGGAFTAFDISYADSTGYYYVADRSNAAVDIINGATDKVVAQAGGPGVFSGQQATTSISGPDGVVVAHTPGGATLFAGNGASNVVAFNVNNPAAPSLLPFSPIGTGGSFRADEMAYSPLTNQLIVANNADSPAFATIINASTGAVQSAHITVPTSPANGGMEQSLWNPNTGTFFVSVPAFNGANNPGGVQEISTSGTILRTFDFTNFGIASCSPAGLALGGNGNLMVGCANAHTQTVVLNPAANGGKGSIQTLAQISGSDEIWYDAADGDFYVTGTDAAGHRAIAVYSDATLSLLQDINLTALGAGVNAHSVAVDPLNGDIFVPLEGTTAAAADTLCPSGCIAVFAMPEPGSLPLTITGVIGILAISLRLRRRTSEA
jgi:hypothetical protein